MTNKITPQPRWVFWAILFSAIGWSYVLYNNLHHWFVYRSTCGQMDFAQDPAAFVERGCHLRPVDDHILVMQIFLVIGNLFMAWLYRPRTARVGE